MPALSNFSAWAGVDTSNVVSLTQLVVIIETAVTMETIPATPRGADAHFLHDGFPLAEAQDAGRVSNNPDKEEGEPAAELEAQGQKKPTTSSKKISSTSTQKSSRTASMKPSTTPTPIPTSETPTTPSIYFSDYYTTLPRHTISVLPVGSCNTRILAHLNWLGNVRDWAGPCAIVEVGSNMLARGGTDRWQTTSLPTVAVTHTVVNPVLPYYTTAVVGGVETEVEVKPTYCQPGGYAVI